MLSMLLKLPDLAEHSPFGLQVIGHGAAPISNALARQATAAFGAALFSVYGITEGGGPSIVGQTDPELAPPRPGAAFLGTPVAGMGTRIVDSNGEPVQSGEAGEILLQGDGVMTGYWSDPAATEQVLRGGWLNTQDVGLTDDLGNYWVLDRRTDLILRGGQNVYPAEIELVLRAIEGVAEAAVVGVPSELWGQTPVAFVVPRSGSELTEADVLQWCAQRLASYKRPSRVEFVPEIPLSPSGKVLRRELRARIEH
jgi:acyl-CoA synthetase (AMP-forming)/AMP-acid ligase II